MHAGPVSFPISVPALLSLVVARVMLLPQHVDMQTPGTRVLARLPDRRECRWQVELKRGSPHGKVAWTECDTESVARKAEAWVTVM